MERMAASLAIYTKPMLEELPMEVITSLQGSNAIRLVIHINNTAAKEEKFLTYAPLPHALHTLIRAYCPVQVTYRGEGHDNVKLEGLHFLDNRLFEFVLTLRNCYNCADPVVTGNSLLVVSD
jgi:hypothetical protein